MRTRPPMLVLAVAVAALTLVSGCEAKVYGESGARTPAPRLMSAVPLAPPVTGPPAPDRQQSMSFAGIEDRLKEATSQAAAAGATITVAVLDRDTGQSVSNGNNQTIAIASVSKLFIADDLLLQESERKTAMSPEDRKALDIMLRSSDDNTAEKFWNLDGGNAIITRVTERYGLNSTRPPNNGRWWNTISSASDLVRYYSMLLDGSGGLPAERADIMLGDLARSTPNGIDGYPQRFGIPEGLPNETVAVKQGWMCCIGSKWMHLSTGLVGPDRRYIMAIGSTQPTNDATARAAITQAVATIFPEGRI